MTQTHVLKSFCLLGSIASLTGVNYVFCFAYFRYIDYWLSHVQVVSTDAPPPCSCWNILIGDITDITLFPGNIANLLLGRNIFSLGSKSLGWAWLWYNFHLSSWFQYQSEIWCFPPSFSKWSALFQRVPGGRFLRRSGDQHLMDWTGFVLLHGGAYGWRGCGVRGGRGWNRFSGCGLPRLYKLSAGYTVLEILGEGSSSIFIGNAF